MRPSRIRCAATALRACRLRPGWWRQFTSIDHWIERCTSLGIEADRVESVAARLHAHPPGDEIASAIRQRRGVDERLGDRLDGEELLGIAHGISHAVHRDEADPQPVGVGLGEFGDVAGDGAALNFRQPAMETFEICLYRGLHQVSFRLLPMMQKQIPSHPEKHHYGAAAVRWQLPVLNPPFAGIDRTCQCCKKAEVKRKTQKRTRPPALHTTCSSD